MKFGMRWNSRRWIWVIWRFCNSIQVIFLPGPFTSPSPRVSIPVRSVRMCIYIGRAKVYNIRVIIVSVPRGTFVGRREEIGILTGEREGFGVRRAAMSNAIIVYKLVKSFILASGFIHEENYSLSPVVSASTTYRVFLSSVSSASSESQPDFIRVDGFFFFLTARHYLFTCKLSSPPPPTTPVIPISTYTPNLSFHRVDLYWVRRRRRVVCAWRNAIIWNHTSRAAPKHRQHR